MADTKISALTALTGANTASDDLLVIVDTSATATKKITLTELQSAPVSAGTANGILYLNGSKVASSGSALTFDGTTLKEAGYAQVTQADIGTAENEVPLTQYFGNLAFMSSDQCVLNPAASAAPAGIGDMVFQLTNDTTLVVKVKGSDGTVRSATLTLA